jgi:hypothetical protein
VTEDLLLFRKYLWVSELRGVDVQNGVVCVVVKGISSISGYGNVLSLDRSGKSVYGDDTIILVWEETARVVDVYDDRSTVDEGRAVCREESNWLVGPGVTVIGRGMAPMLVASYGIGWIVLYGQLYAGSHTKGCILH